VAFYFSRCKNAIDTFFMINKHLLIGLSFLAMVACNNGSETPIDVDPNAEEAPFDVSGAIQADPIIDSISKYLEKNATDAGAFAFRARRQLELRNLAQALNDADLAVTIDSTNAFAQLVKGEVYYIANKTRISKDAWTTCIALEPKSIPCRMKLAELYNVIESYRQSLRLVNEVIEMDPTIPEAFFMKGLNIVGLYNDTAQAMPYLQKAIELDEDYFEALDLLGVWLTNRRDPRAGAYLNRAVELKPEAPMFYKIGFFLKEMNRYEEAVEALSKAVQLNPRDHDAYFLMGYVFVEMEAYEEALDAFSNCLRIREINHKAYYARGYTHELMGNINAARSDYGEALRNNPAHEASRDAMMRIQGK
jgi:tetratricopeptide (TPR) repeat protein